MWNDFTDLELLEVLNTYDLGHFAKFDDRMVLINRPELEKALNDFEYQIYTLQ